jgi:hypothetical protein
MEEKESRNQILRKVIIDQSKFIELLVSALVLAIGVNLVSDSIQILAGQNYLCTLLPGIILCLLPICYQVSRFVGSRIETREYYGFLIHDTVTNEILPVPRYNLGETIPVYLKGAFLENKGRKALWDKEPLDEFNIIHNLEPGTGSGLNILCTGVARESGTDLFHLKEVPESFNLVCEAVEYHLLAMLSSHLYSYFNTHTRFTGQDLVKYSRQDLPDTLLSNRFLELFSKPEFQRPVFFYDYLQEWSKRAREIFDVRTAWTANGAIYHKLELVLPRGSVIEKRQTSPGFTQIEIKTNRMSIALGVLCVGGLATLPSQFKKYYLKTDGGTRFTALKAYDVHIYARISLKPGALLSPVGWGYYYWIDSFLEELEKCVSTTAFLQFINWNSTLTVLDCLNRDHYPGSNAKDSDAQTPSHIPMSAPTME